MRLKENRLYFVVFISILYFLLSCYFSPNVRGSDQYWYEGDVERLVNIDGLAKTNNIFPASLPSTDSDLPRPWVQNRPVVYLVAGIAFVIRNVHISWILLNCICLFLSAFLIASLIDKRNRQKFFVLLYLSFLLFPLNFYLSLQPLAELFNVLLVSLLIYLLLRSGRQKVHIILISLISGLLIWQRENYILLLLIVPFLILVPEKKKNIISIFSFFIITLFMILIKPILFPSDIIHNVGIIDIVMNVRPGTSNMSNYLYTSFPHYSFKEMVVILLAKISDAIKIQFNITDGSAVFFYSINLLLPAYLLLLIKNFRQKRVIVITVFILIHFITIILFQNQYRYSCVIIPPLFLANYWYFSSLEKVSLSKLNFIFKYTLFLFIFLISGLSLFIGHQNKKEAIKEAITIEGLRSLENNIGKNNILAEFDGGSSLKIAYAFSPRLVFFFPADFAAEKMEYVGKRLRTGWVILNKHGKAYSNLKGNASFEKAINGMPESILVCLNFSRLN